MMNILNFYFLFTLFWPPEITFHSLPKQINYFTIHGIWPEFYNHSWPQFCNHSQPFNQSAIHDLIPLLKYVWYDYNHQDPDEFWKHEWEKHGTCSEKVLSTEKDYFSKALDLHQKYNILQILENNDIEANDTYYETKKIQNILNEKIGGDVRMMCQKDNLKSLEICFDTNFDVMDCKRKSECSDKTFFKSF